ncbi:Vacuolar protein sorting-associated protein 13, partial [Basidiobolus ranarum]
MFETIVANILNKFLGSYVTNLETTQLGIGIWQGDVVLRGLRLRKEALDKLNLPVNVLEGYLGELTLKIPWKNLKNQPVRVSINNVYLLAVPRGEDSYDPEEEENREQALKQHRLDSYEALNAQSKQADSAEDFKSMSFTMQLVTKIVDNLQVSINNIHIRYEDKTSNPKHPFAFGMTLSGLSAISTNENWQEVFIDQSFEKVHKLLKLESLAIYWNTKIETFAGKSYSELIDAFTKMIASDKNQQLKHQFILKPVSGVGRLMLNKTFSEDVPKNIALLLFEEFGFTLDNEQYRDILLVADLFEYSARQKMYRSYDPPRHVLPKENPRAWFQYAIRCVLSEIKARNRRWTWEYFAERRGQRNNYVKLYIDSKLNRLDLEGEEELHDLEWSLSFEDIRMYRFLAKSKMKKEKALLAKQQQKEQPSGWFGGWFGGWSSEKPTEEETEILTDEQKQELLATIDFDESQPESAFEISEECVILSLTTQIKTGSLALKESPHSKNHSIASLVFDTVTMEFLNRPDSFKCAISLHGLNLYDGTTKGTLYPLLMRVEDSEDDSINEVLIEHECLNTNAPTLGLQNPSRNPFFRLVFEHNPLDNRADDARSSKMRYLEVIYNQCAIETIMRFFKPPVSQMESMTALMEAAGNTLDGLTQQTRAGIKYALEEHKTLDVSIDINAPIFIFPESPTDPKAHIVVFDSGHITVQSKLVSKEQKIELEEALGPSFSLENNPKLENLLYDRFLVEMSSVQVLVGQSVDACLEMIQNVNLEDKDNYWVLDRINMSFLVDVSIIPKAPNITGLRISGRLPLLKINISNTKYKTIMHILEIIAGPQQDNVPQAAATSLRQAGTHRHSIIGIPFSDMDPVDLMSESSSEQYSVYGEDNESQIFRDDDGDDEFFDAEEIQEGENAVVNNPSRKLIEFTFEIDKLSASLRRADSQHPYSETSLADMHLHNFALIFTQKPYDMNATVTIRSLYVDDCMSSDPNFKHIVTSDIDGVDGQQELVQFIYKKASPESPEYISKFESIDQSLELSFSSVNVIITSRSILTLHDFLLTTFVSEARANSNLQLTEAAMETDTLSVHQSPPSTTKIVAKMNSISFILNDDGVRLSTISLLRGDVALLLKQSGLRVGAKLGNISVTDDVKQEGSLHTFRPLFTIHSDELAVFRYETFPVDEVGYPGYDSSVFLRVGSVRMTFLEKPIQDLLKFTSKFTEMHVLFETARQAAAESAAQLHQSVSRMHFDIVIRTPILVFPKKMNSKDTLNVNLGEISMTNTFTNHPDSIEKSLDNIRFRIKDIRLTSSIYFLHASHQILQIIDDVDIELNAIYGEHLKNSKRPDTEITGSISDIKMSLTQAQYMLLLEIANSVSRTFSGSKEVKEENVDLTTKAPKIEPTTTYTKATLPFRRGAVAIDFWTLIDLRLVMKIVHLEIFAEEKSKSHQP